MREIKFRAYVPKLKKMGKVSEINWMTKTLLVATNRVVNDIYRLTQVKLMQYTGSKGIDGVPIYEGDGLESADGELVGVVHFKDGAFMVGVTYLWEWDYETKVCGNIYQNPELLEEIK